jgi:hypothetical protein
MQLRFHVTHHQAMRLSERNLSLEFIKSTVSYPDRKQMLNKGHNGGNLMKFFKTVEKRTMVVVAEIKGSDCWLATAYYEN